jgi:hypothetical protein
MILATDRLSTTGTGRLGGRRRPEGWAAGTTMASSAG